MQEPRGRHDPAGDELARHPVGRAGIFDWIRDLAAAQLGDQRLEIAGIAAALVAEPPRAHRADPGPQHRTGDPAGIDDSLRTWAL